MYRSLTKFLRKWKAKYHTPASLVIPIIVLSILFRFYILLEFTPSCCGSDEGVYHSIAKHLVTENKFIFTQQDDTRTFTDVVYGAKPPLYPYFIASIYGIFGSNPLWVKVIQIVFISSLTGYAIFKIAQKSGSDFIAITALAVFSFFWETAHMSVTLLSENLYWLLLSLYLLCLLRTTQKPHVRFAFYAGLLLGLLVLVRPPSLTFIIPSVIFLLIYLKLKITIKHSLVLIFFTLVSLTPWTIRNYNIYNKFVFIYTDGAINMWMGNYKGSGGTYNPPMANVPGQIPSLKSIGPEREVERDNYYSSLALTYIKTYPLDALDIAFRKIFMTFSTYRPYVLNSTSVRGEWPLARQKSLGVDALMELVVDLEFAALSVFFFIGSTLVILKRNFRPIYLCMIMFFLWHLLSIAATHSEPRYITHMYTLMIPLMSIPVWLLIKSLQKFR